MRKTAKRIISILVGTSVLLSSTVGPNIPILQDHPLIQDLSLSAASTTVYDASATHGYTYTYTLVNSWNETDSKGAYARITKIDGIGNSYPVPTNEFNFPSFVQDDKANTYPVIAIQGDVFQSSISNISNFKINTTVVTNKADYVTENKDDVLMIIPETVKYIGNGLFSGFGQLKVLALENKINIGAYDDTKGVFEGCIALTTVKLHESITEIGARAFQDCTGLKSINLENVSYLIGNSAFKGCTVLNNISFSPYRESQSVLNIMESAFEGCTKLQHNSNGDNWIEIPPHVISIGSKTFYGCKSLEKVIVGSARNDDDGDGYYNDSLYYDEKGRPYGTQEINSSAFEGCTSLREINLSDAPLKNIKDRAFFNTAVKDIKFPEELIYIGISAFEQCKQLETFNLEKQITRISDRAFYGCDKIKKVHLPAYIGGTIGEYVFANCTSLEELIFDEDVSSIAAYSFSGCTGLKAVEFPSTMTQIGKNAFEKCTNLDRIIVPANTITLGADAFTDTKLSTVVLKSSGAVTNVPYAMFKPFAPYLKDVVLAPDISSDVLKDTTKQIPTNPSTLKVIGENSFIDCTRVPKITLPEGVTRIEVNAFSGATGLLAIYIPSSIVDIDPNAFNGIPNLIIYSDDENFKNRFYQLDWYDSVSKPNGKLTFEFGTEIPPTKYPEFQYSAPSKDNRITITGYNSELAKNPSGDIVIPNRIDGYEVEGLAATAFKDNKDITSVKFMESDKWTTLAAGSFSGCTSLRTIELPSTLTSMGANIFDGDTSLESISIPNRVTIIPDYAFRGCTALKTASLGNNVTEIGTYAFSGSGLTEITLPDALLNLKPYAFSDTKELMKMYIPAKSITIGKDAITKNVNSQVIDFYVKDGVTELKDNIFKNYGSLIVNLQIPSSVETVSPLAFAGLVNPTIFSTSAAVGSFAQTNKLYYENSPVIPYSQNSNFTYTVSNNIATITAYKDSSLAVTIPGYINGYRVTTFTAAAFPKELNIQSISIKENITDIPASAFEGFTALNTVSLPSTLKTIGNKGFFGCVALAGKIEIPEGFTSLGTSAFTGCGLIDEITIPSTCINIPTSAFKDCSILKVLNIKNGVKTIGANAFENCIGLENIKLPDSLDTINAAAFKGATALETIEFGGGLITISANAFEGNTSLKTVVFPQLIRTIAANAFAGCSKLTSIEVPAKVISVEKNAFPSTLKNIKIKDGEKTIASNALASFKDYLTEIELPDSVETIEPNAFSGCPNLKKIILPNDVKTIGKLAFSNDTSLQMIYIPSSVESIGEDAFKGCPEMLTIFCEEGSFAHKYARDNHIRYEFSSIPDTTSDDFTYTVLTNGAVRITAYTGDSVNITIPERIDDYLVTELAETAFKGNTVIESLSLPSTIASIPANAFSGCTSLSNISFAEGLKTIGNSALSGCIKLTSVKLPESCRTLGESVFVGCNALNQVDLGTGLTTISKSAFSGITGLVEITIPSTVKTIGDLAFNSCSNLSTVILNEGVESIGNSAFASTRITEIALPDTIKTLGTSAFANCILLKTVKMPSKTDNITEPMIFPNGLFSGCTTLREFLIPGYVEEDDDDDDEDFANALVIPNYVISIEDNAFNNCSSIVKLKLSDSVTKIGANAFANCTSIEKVHLGKVTQIGVSAFSGVNSLAELTIPDSVTSIGNNAFSGCTKLDKLFIPAKSITIGTTPFNNAPLTSIEITKTKGEKDGDEGETIIPKAAFTNYASFLTNITLPDNVKIIGESAFENCNKLTKIEITSPVTTIQQYAFMNCSALTEVIIANSVTNIAANTFYRCNKNLKIYGYPMISNGLTLVKTYVESYAESNGIAFALLSDKQGDPNGDQISNIFDIILIRDYIAGKVSLTVEQFVAADANGDGDVDIRDMIYIRDEKIFGGSLSSDCMADLVIAEAQQIIEENEVTDEITDESTEESTDDLLISVEAEENVYE